MAPTTSRNPSILAGRYSLSARDPRFSRLFSEAVGRPPRGAPRITTVRSVTLSRRPTRTTVGLTRYSKVRYFLVLSRPQQTITFYASLLDALSDSAAMAVMAHELAHAWLNEHLVPEESRKREHEADALGRKWGFGPELDALDKEAETVHSE
jgi:Zn-dependent protease with chaperone function